MTIRQLLPVATLMALSVLAIDVAGQGRGVAPAELLKPLADSWPTYSGDYSGKRYSALKQINQATVKNLTLAWVAKLNEAVVQGGFGFAAADAEGRRSSLEEKAPANSWKAAGSPSKDPR